jgi:hypothetical protein
MSDTSRLRKEQCHYSGIYADKDGTSCQMELKSTLCIFRTLQWSWFALVMTCVHGTNLHRFCLKTSRLQYIAKVTHYVDYIVYVGGCLVLIATVLTFKKNLVRFQVSQVSAPKVLE